MAPPQFKDLGKKAKDLFKKNYDFKNEVKVINTTNGVKIESGGLAGKTLVGHSKANWKDEYLGAIEVEAHSCGLAKGQAKLNKIVDGLNVTVAGGSCGGVSVEATYAQPLVAATAKASHNLSKGVSGLSASVTTGVDCISLGGSVDLDGSSAPKDYNVGVQYAQKEITGAVVTSKKLNVVTGLVSYQLCKKMLLGASGVYDIASSKSTFAVGHDYKMDGSTAVRSKLDSNGTYSVAVTHTLENPALKVGASYQYNTLGDNAFKPEKFGVSLSFGEY